ncbi:hypothetical protein E4U24_006058 [Claviceps purpurea]|nr:hypothetical protein E4U24_006058 [Claviceps purpurea]
MESAGYDAIQSDPDRHPDDARDALDCALESRAARAFSCEAGAGASPIATNPTSSTSRTSDYVAAAAAAMAATHAQSGGAMRVSSHPDGIDNGSLPVVISRGQFPVPWPIGRCPLPPPFPGPNNPMHYLGGHHS